MGTKIFWLLVTVAMVFRVTLTPVVFHGDTLIQASWGQIIADKGAKGFYENSYWTYISPNQPPLITLIYSWGFRTYLILNNYFIRSGMYIHKHNLGGQYIPDWYRFIDWWSNTKYMETPFKWGELISMKLYPIVGDGILALMIYKLVSKKTNIKTARIVTLIYLLSPFSWYESAIWGQHDQLALILLLGAFMVAATDKYEIAAPILMMTSIVIKPTGLIFGPLMLWLSVKNKRKFGKIMIGGVIALVGYYGLVRVFSDLQFVAFNKNLLRQMFEKGEGMTWANTFNFWRIVTTYLTDYKNTFIGINYKIWGYLMFFLVNIFAFSVGKKRDWDGTLKAIFIVGFGGWLTMVTMHDRYLFTAVVTGLILSASNKGLWKYWWILSIIFWINMFCEWWFPGWMGWLRFVLTLGSLNDGILPKLLAIVNCFLFFRMAKVIK